MRFYATVLILVPWLFLLVAHKSGFASSEEFCHPNYDMCYGWNWAFTFIRLLYSSIFFSVIPLWIKPPRDGMIIFYAFIFLQALDAIDWYFNYWQTYFREPLGVFVLIVIGLYVIGRVAKDFLIKLGLWKSL